MLTRLVRRVLFPGHLRAPNPGAGEAIDGLERWVREVGRTRVEAWYLPARTGTGPRPALLFAHGNGELIDDWVDALDAVRDMGVHVLLPEYRGYGRSSGEPSEAATLDDFRWFHRRMRERAEIDPARLVFMGRSLGGGAVCALAAHVQPRALVLLSTFESARAMARRYLVPGFLVLDAFDSLAVVGALEVPIWILHGVRDDLVPVSHARALAAAAKNARLSLYDADHNDCPPDWAAFLIELRAFLVEVGALE